MSSSKDPNDTLYGISATRLDGSVESLAQYRDKVLLIVNTASQCGFTPQLSALEELYQKYSSRGFYVLGFPCNQFGKQEPGSSDDIAAFCKQNYGVTFPLFAKVNVNGKDAHPLFAHLKEQQPGLMGSKAIKWNFTKFLVNRTGTVTHRFAPNTTPDQLDPVVGDSFDRFSASTFGEADQRRHH